MKLHLVRHGATISSGRTYAGRADVPLTEAGHAQARAAADALAERPIGLILASPLSRARDTARPLADRLGLPVLVEPALTEFDFGAYEGRTKAEIGLKLRKAHLNDPIPGGEALIDVWRRAAAVLDRLRTDAPNGTEAVCVGHFWINRLIHGHCLGQSLDATCRDRGYRPETGSVRTLDLPA